MAYYFYFVIEAGTIKNSCAIFYLYVQADTLGDASLPALIDVFIAPLTLHNQKLFVVNKMVKNQKERTRHMPRRGENIRKRKDGRWEGRYIKGRDSLGKAQYGYVFRKSYKEVKEAVQQLRASLAAATTHSSAEVTFAVLLQLWLDSAKLYIKQSTYSHYLFVIERHLLASLGSIPAGNINQRVIDSFLQEKLERGRLDKTGGLSPKTVRDTAAVIQTAIRYEVENSLITDPHICIKLPHYRSPEHQILSSQEQKILEQYLLSVNSNASLGILLCLYSGLRLGELCALQWKDLDLQKQVILVRKTIHRIRNPDLSSGSKTVLVVDTPKSAASQRTVPLFPFLLPLLEQMKALSDEEAYFLTGKVGVPMEPRRYQNIFQKCLANCGIAPINFHSLRHSFASRCLLAGFDLKTLSEILGHSSASITLNRYVHTSMEEKQMQMQKLKVLSLF